ncbi:class I SAM-dependent methyltransferase [Psychrobacter glacincola]|uniref:Class I SAM-dependent methyltransferase n=1 Tax=Psychrobacter glacincola TaxID=56810 RepID=A0ABW1W3V4_9GAMM|nr:class I SAM-dependent methyltransferase [Psychrobacter glacincola]
MDNNLDSIAEKSLFTTPAGNTSLYKSFDIFMRFAKKGSVLELGCAEGLMTEKIVNFFDDVAVVEGSSIFCEQLKKKLPNVEVFNSYFEDFDCDRKFDNIILGHVLEHVDDPVFVLSHIKKFLKTDGLIFAAVPNARSIHRQAAVIMGILENEYSLNSLDIHHGHQRVFNPESFRSVFIKANLPISIFGGYWLKPLSNGQIEADWSEEMLDAFMDMGERYPDISGEIYIVSYCDR